jgi:integrase
LNAGVEWGYLSKSPARPRAFKAPSEKRVRPIRPFESMAEVEAVCQHLAPTGAAIVRFAVATGIRLPGEALSLRWTDISTSRREAQIQGTKTENAPRTIPLSHAALEAIQDLPRSIIGQVFVLNYHYWRKEEWTKALTAAGLEHRTPYECRHTFATFALQAGASLDDVAQVLGHADISITRRYYRKWTRPMADRLRGILDGIGAADDAAERNG